MTYTKYPQRMARPRQWGKKFTNIHHELKHAQTRYAKRYNTKKNYTALGKQSAKYRKTLHKSLSYGKWKLNTTKGYKGGKKFKSSGGHKVWRKGNWSGRGMTYRG